MLALLLIGIGIYLFFKIGGSSNNSSHYGTTSPGNSMAFTIVICLLLVGLYYVVG